MSVFYFTPNEGETLIVNNKILTEDDGVFSTEISDGYLIVSAFKSLPSETKRHFLTLNAVIKISEGKVKLFGDLLLIKNGDNYEIKYKLPYLDEYSTPSALAQKTAKHKNKDCSVTVYSDNGIHIMCEYEGTVYLKDIPYLIYSPSVQMQPTAQGLLIAVTAEADEKKYLCVIMFKDTFVPLYSGLADETVFTNNSFVLKHKLKDMLGRECRESYAYSDGSFKLIDTEYDLTRNVPFPPTLIPCLFLEAVMAKDYASAKNYLAEDLGDTEAIKAFLGEFDDFAAVESSGLPDTYVLYNNRIKHGVYQPRRFKFETDNKVILNINEA